jgi:hypothetical protein
LPKVYGYFEQDFNGQLIALLVVPRMAFTFDQMIQRQRHICPTMPNLILVLKCVLAVVRQLINAAKLNLKLRDWHIGNVGFTDEVDAQMILIDWEGNEPAPANLTEVARMDSVFHCFSNSLVSPYTWRRDDISGQSIEVQNNIKKWRVSLTCVRYALISWWKDMQFVANFRQIRM